MANRYWVGGTGNWSNTARWSETSGGAGGASVPTAADNVIFDSGSASDNYTVTVDAAASCLDFTMGKPTGASKKVTLAGSAAISVYGSASIPSTAEATMSQTSTFSFVATSGTKTITSNGNYYRRVNINGTGGTFQLADDLIALSTLTYTAGTFDANGKKVVMSSGSGIVNGSFTGSNSFYDFEMTGSAATTRYVSFSGDITVTHTLTLAGNSATNRLLVYSSTIGTQRTITLGTGATISASNVDFKDIKLYDTDTSGADIDLSAITGLSGDCGGNSGIIFTDSDTMTWKDGDGGNWSDVGNWTKTAAAADRVPLPQDDVNLGVAFNASQTVTADMPRLGRSIDWTGATGVPTFDGGTTESSIFGSLTLITATTGMVMSGTGAYTFEGRGNYTLTSAENVWERTIQIFAYGGKLTLQDNYNSLTKNIYGGYGEFDANDKDVTIVRYSTNALGDKILRLGNGTWTILGGAIPFNFGSQPNSTTLYAENSTIKLTNSSNDTVEFAGARKTYYNVWFSRGTSTGNITISGSNTFNQLKDTGTEAHSLIFTAGTTQTFTGTTPFVVNGSAGKLITLASSTTTAFNLVSTSGYDISCDYLSISRSNVSPVNTWYAGINSTNGGNNTGWNFTVPKHDDFLIMF